MCAFTTDIPFLRWRKILFVFSGTLAVLSVVLLFAKGLNFGIDFEGGILIEVGTERPADIGGMRAVLGDLGLGEVSLQKFGSDTEVLIRIERQSSDAEDQLAITAVREVLDAKFAGEITYRRTERVGAKVGAELIEAGIIDPAKVTRGALENAASIAAMILTTEALVTDIPEEAAPPPMPPPEY